MQVIFYSIFYWGTCDWRYPIPISTQSYPLGRQLWKFQPLSKLYTLLSNSFADALLTSGSFSCRLQLEERLSGPKTPADLLRYCVRWDYDGIVTKEDGKEYHKYQLQPNAGIIPSSIKQWRDKNGGTAVMTTLYIPRGVEPEASVFEHAMDSAMESIPWPGKYSLASYTCPFSVWQYFIQVVNRESQSEKHRGF